MSRSGYFLISEELTEALEEKEWNALFDGLGPNDITGQTHMPDQGLIKVEIQGPEIEPGTEYTVTFTYEAAGTVSARLQEVGPDNRTLAPVA